MTQSEKAKELVYKHSKIYFGISIEHTITELCKAHAIIAVDEAIKIVSLINDGCGKETTLDYWQEVKEEIKKI
jgi:uncharacterized protein (DUF342 family)